jgi:uncharacterized protein YbgA (DUF1722 family)/uncharacterized protein YbbK (DUF523 family)
MKNYFGLFKMLKVGISQCLLGANVRYDGGHRSNKFCTNELAQLFDFTVLCPEVGIGLPIPRKSIRLVGNVDAPRAVLSSGGSNDYTEKLSNFANDNYKILEQLCGYIVCKASPSCGMERVKVYGESGQSQSKGIGIFTARLKSLLPLLPMEEDGRLNDPSLRDSFIKRVYLYNEWQEISAGNKLSVKALMAFHTKHKMTLLAHCQQTYRKLGPLVASANISNIKEISAEYIHLKLEGMKKTATRSKNTNVLMHLQGHLKKLINRDDKAELRQCIIDYNHGLQPIMAPLTLLKHHFRNNPSNYIQQLSFFDPYPKQLAIRVAMK